MTALTRIDGCKGRFAMKLPTDAVGTEQVVVDMESFTWNRTAENRTFKTMNNCAEQTGEGSTAYTISGDMIYATEDVGQQLFKEGTLLDWVFFPDYNDVGSATESKVSGTMRVDSLDFTLSTDDSHKASFSATGDGDYTAVNMW